MAPLRHRLTPLRLTILLASAVLCLCVWRAITQSITIDEAFTYNEYVSQGWSGVFLKMDQANNHVLFSALAKVSTDLFGVSEFTLRIPTLLGAVLFLLCIARIGILMAPGYFVPVLFLGVAALNPMTLDFLVAARGYGLAMGFLAWGVLEVLLWSSEERQPGPADAHLVRASVAAALSAASNLAFAFASLSLISVVAATVLVRRARGRLRSLAAVSLPGMAMAAAVLAVPLWNADPKAFYWGADTIAWSVETVVNGAMTHPPGANGPFGSWNSLRIVRLHFLPAVLAVCALFVGWWAFKSKETRSVLLFCVFALTGAGILAAHSLYGVPYPAERTGLPLVFLFLACATSAAASWWSGRVLRFVLAVPAFALLGLFLLQVTTQLRTGYFSPWPEQAHIREAVRAMGNVTGRIGAQWWFQPSLEFYRKAWRLRFAPVERMPGDQPSLDGYDYYVLQNPAPAALRAHKLRILYRDPFSEITVAAAQRPQVAETLRR